MRGSTRQITLVIGSVMLFAMILSAVAPLMQQSVQNQTDVIPPTATLAPTSIPPMTEAELNSLSFDQTYLHPTGLFSVAVPAGWEPTQPVSNVDRAHINLVNVDRGSVVEAYVEIPPVSPTTMDELDAHFTQDLLDQSWSRYREWEELERRRDGDKLIIDFLLSIQERDFIARQVAWIDGNWIDVVRVITPDSAPETLRFVLDHLMTTFHTYRQFANTPAEWQAYFDPVHKHIIRYPITWTLADSAPGQPASLSGGETTMLRLEAQAGTAASDEDAARAWVETAREGAEILSVEPVTRSNAEGFSVTYQYADLDGDTWSGLAVLLNGPDEALHVANLRFLAPTVVDLNADEVDLAYTDAVRTMETFSLLPLENVVPSGVVA